jgi:type VI protein secretion system component VasK
MSFGISAAAWLAGAAVVAAGATVYSASESAQARRTSRNSLKAGREIDQANTAKAESDAQNSANGKIADAKRRRRASSLLSSETLGGPSTALGAGASAMPSTATSALGAGRVV